ncbi:hypothetical protein TGP89_357730 [Toxoplasma gondii p89]|uniref:Uncharacterized protein n=1 Tax=Toxoplasma gondii p89 TaxID=943119 RepID=A0A086L6Z6_TOXGO|nr:hypothetical protein TGP89_357730 [Toxoplasma gondii p89]
MRPGIKAEYLSRSYFPDNAEESENFFQMTALPFRATTTSCSCRVSSLRTHLQGAVSIHLSWPARALPNLPVSCYAFCLCFRGECAVTCCRCCSCFCNFWGSCCRPKVHWSNQR